MSYNCKALWLQLLVSLKFYWHICFLLPSLFGGISLDAVRNLSHPPALLFSLYINSFGWMIVYLFNIV
ncbi:hypothetical protein L1987_47136 [Smallanthus sonchifolius]|uniref:Uncharacterized protein n=1 Tax=Smallanthus sonchifolius TaxID=185202 RepID=A0ACB9G288_9ASTR|nr:hypothetical protein L1987_47136 [Smallanthus sonchifolius]